MSERGQEPSAPPMCAAGCGFFGNPASENLCSKCYRDRHPAQTTSITPSIPISFPTQTPTPTLTPAPTPVSTTPPLEITPASGASASASGASAGAASPSKGKNRCFTCNKSVGLLGVVCRCEQQFCSKHRHASDHNCSFDYKAYDRKRIEEANPVIANSKIEKI